MLAVNICGLQGGPDFTNEGDALILYSIIYLSSVASSSTNYLRNCPESIMK